MLTCANNSSSQKLVMEKLKLVIVLLLICDIRGSSAQSLPCTTASGDNCTSSVCPNTVVTYTCTIPSGTAAGYTDWNLPNGTCPTNAFPNQIKLSQFANGQCSALGAFGVLNMCGPYRASSILPSSGMHCLSSILAVNITAAMNGITVMCNNTNINNGASTVVSMATINVVASPGAPSNVQSSMVCTNSLTIQWTPATSGYAASNYSIILTNTSGTTVAVNTTNSTMTTIGDLIDGTNYTVSVTAINCAGSSNSSSVGVQTLPCAPVSVSVTTVFYQNNSVYDVELFWTHRQQSCSVPQYTVMVTSATSTYSNCTSSSCLYIFGMSGANVNSYNVSVACRNTLYQIGQPYVAMQSVPDPNSVLQVNQSYVNVEENIATITCRFLANSSLYCMVCCSTDPSVPAGSVSLVGSSSTNGPTVRVTLQGFTSSIYYCKAAATNTNSNNCAGPVVGGVKVFFSFNTSYMPPSPTPTTTPSNPPEGGNVGAIAGGVVGGVGGALLLVVIVVIVVVIILMTKGGKGGGREDTMELGKSGSISTPPPGSNDGTGAMYQDPKAIQHVQGPGGETYAMADKPTKTSNKASDKAKKPTATVAPATDAGGAMYQDPKDIQHTTTQAGETYAVADKKPKPVGHVQAPAGDLYAVADAKRR